MSAPDVSRESAPKRKATKLARYHAERARLKELRVPVPRGLRKPFIPLAVGIKKTCPEKLRPLLNAVIETGQYRAAVALKGSQRHDLDGNVVGDVEPAHRKHARSSIIRAAEKLRERRAAQRERASVESEPKVERARLSEAMSKLRGGKTPKVERG